MPRRFVAQLNLLAQTLLLSLSLTAAQAQAPQATGPLHLQVTTPAALVDCQPVTPVPCMSLGVTAVNSSGKPAPLALPPARELAGALSVQAAGAADAVHPFYAVSGSGIDAAQHTNVVLLIIDISGSMNDPSPGAPSRFAAVKDAVTRYVNAMQEGSDQIAIVPFESHNVVSTIQAAVFSSHKADVLAQLNALPQPGPKNNTALFQAVYTGVDSMKRELAALQQAGHAAAELQPHVLVMTDGKNEVFPGDDPNLLNGPLGLQQAAAQVTAAHFDVIGVGFGDRGAIDADALEHLSTRFFYAADSAQLLDALHVTRTETSHVINMTWLLPANNRFELMGRDQTWIPTLNLPSGASALGEPVRMVMPATTAPLYGRAALHAELERLIAVHPPTLSGWSSVVVHLLLFLAAAALLLVLWFWVPRLVWGERAPIAAAFPGRWTTGQRNAAPAAGAGSLAGTGSGAPGRQTVTSASAVQIRSTATPPGFQPRGDSAGVLQRSAAQTTQVGPRPEPGRSRLDFE